MTEQHHQVKRRTQSGEAGELLGVKFLPLVISPFLDSASSPVKLRTLDQSETHLPLWLFTAALPKKPLATEFAQQKAGAFQSAPWSSS